MAGLSLPHILPRIENPALELRKYANFLLALMARRGREAIVAANPFEVTVDTSTICQLQCPYCDVGNGTIQRGRALLKPATHRGFIEDLAEDMFIAWYFSTGEPLINRRFAELVSAIRDRSVFPIVSTNLSLRLSDARIDELLTCGLGVICVSLDGATPETYVRYRVGGDYDLVVENIRRLVRRKLELGLELPLIEWRFLVFRHNQHELPRVRQLAAELEVDLLELFAGYAPDDAGPDQVQRAIDLALTEASVGPAYARALARRDTTLRRLLADAPPGDDSAPSQMLGQKCDWLYFGATLFPNGAVSPCCVSNHEPDDFGKVAPGDRFSGVWNNARYQAARAMFVDGSRPDLVCSRCPLPSAQDYQFRTSIRAILRNAPDWALWLIAQDPDRFFFDVDFRLSPVELAPFRDGRITAAARPRDSLQGLAIPSAAPAGRPDIGWLLDTLARAS